MNVLIIGSGGREAALAWKLAQSSQVASIIVAPGNAGMLSISSKIMTLEKFEIEQMLLTKIDLVVIGPELPLCEGLSDRFRQKSIPVVGPSKEAAKLEGSKAFCKEVMLKAGIPTPSYELANTLEEAVAIIEASPLNNLVLKVDELAQGKGVVVCDNKEKAYQTAQAFFDGTFLGSKSKKLLIEECLSGPEISAFALCDGMDFLYLGSATDYKRLMDGDVGPNTGGMGTISPSPILSEADEVWIKENVFKPLLKEMSFRGTPFQGFLFAGLMKTNLGFSVLEFNVRLGDPETQSLIPRIQGDLFPILKAAAGGDLKNHSIHISNEFAIHVVMCAKGYPGVDGVVIQKDDVIEINKLTGKAFFFPAAMRNDSGKLVTSGGRICGVTALDPLPRIAYENVYRNVENIKFKGSFYRKDIGKKFL